MGVYPLTVGRGFDSATLPPPQIPIFFLNRQMAPAPCAPTPWGEIRALAAGSRFHRHGAPAPLRSLPARMGLGFFRLGKIAQGISPLPAAPRGIRGGICLCPKNHLDIRMHLPGFFSKELTNMVFGFMGIPKLNRAMWTLLLLACPGGSLPGDIHKSLIRRLWPLSSQCRMSL